MGYSQLHRDFVSEYLNETLTAPRCISVKHRGAHPWVFIDAIKSPQRTRPSALTVRRLPKSIRIPGFSERTAPCGCLLLLHVKRRGGVDCCLKAQSTDFLNGSSKGVE